MTDIDQLTCAIETICGRKGFGEYVGPHRKRWGLDHLEFGLRVLLSKPGYIYAVGAAQVAHSLIFARQYDRPGCGVILV